MTAETDAPDAFTTDFAAEFSATEADWRKAAEAALKGRPLDSILHGKLLDDVAFEAIAPRGEATPIAGRPAGARWTAMTRIDIAEPAAANAQALEDLNNGASGLSLILGPTGANPDRLDETLVEVLLDLAAIHLDAAPFAGAEAARKMAALIEKRGDKPSEANILFGLDLIRDLLSAGGSPRKWDAITAETAELVEDLTGSGFAAPILLIDQRFTHDAGASEALELATALSSAVEHLRLLGADKLDAMGLAFAIDANQFAGIAKLRAARLLWTALRRELGLDEKPVHIHAQTSLRMMTRNDSQTNMVRTTIAAFAAGVGGADSIVALPHTIVRGAVDGDARRIARNTQAIVLEETNAYRVADPAAGAGAIEQMTDALAERAWALFQEIEGAGGLLAAITSGAWQAMVAKSRGRRERDVATRKTPVVGVSQFPKADEDKPGPAPESAPSISIADLRIEAPAPARLSEPFETLRAENEARSPRPTVYLALVGPIARHATRAGFMRNLLEAGGVLIEDGPIDGDAAAIAEAFKASGASIAVVTGADADYDEAGVETARALAAAGATVWLAGRPRDGVDALEGAGVARFVAAGDDALDILAAASKANGGAS